MMLIPKAKGVSEIISAAFSRLVSAVALGSFSGSRGTAVAISVGVASKSDVGWVIGSSELPGGTVSARSITASRRPLGASKNTKS